MFCGKGKGRWVRGDGGGRAEAGQGGGERALAVILSRQGGAVQRCLGTGELAGTVAPSSAEVRGVGGAVTVVPGLSGAWAGAAWARVA